MVYRPTTITSCQRNKSTIMATFLYFLHSNNVWHSLSACYMQEFFKCFHIWIDLMFVITPWGIVITPILHVKKLRQTDIKELPKNTTIYNITVEAQIINPGNILVQKSVFLSITLLSLLCSANSDWHSWYIS